MDTLTHAITISVFATKHILLEPMLLLFRFSGIRNPKSWQVIQEFTVLPLSFIETFFRGGVEVEGLV